MDNIIENEAVGLLAHKWATDLFPINRSLTGEGVRQTLTYLKNIIPELNILSIKSNTQVFDWVIPDEWLINDAYICDDAGNKIVDFKVNNLHVVGYSEPVNMTLPLDELQNYLHSLPDMPDAIPYVTSYYKRRWGFCLTDNQRKNLKPGNYKVVIDSKLFPGEMNYGELILPGETEQEILLSTYICHPSMANNELSGPVVTTALAKWLTSLPKTKYTYRIIFIPETIGAIAYLANNLKGLKEKVVAGYQITCIGDDRCFSFLPSRKSDTISDKVALHVLKHLSPNFKHYSFLDRGSDERQFCAPGVDLPIASIMRSKYAEYPEYHTSFDDLKLVTPSGLAGGFTALKRSIEILEFNCKPLTKILCEPQLGKRGLYPTLSTKHSYTKQISNMMDLIAYSDGTMSLLDIAELLQTPFWTLVDTYKELEKHGILEASTN